MKTVGIIAEYNPFHNGHAYQIAEAKRITGADYAVVVMSGDFVQRGTPAVWDKYTRTRAALLGGADLVFELPVVYATASAEYFAEGGVALLTALGVDTLCFGSECGDINALMAIAKLFTNESPEFKSALTQSLREGKSYPVAREDAYRAHCVAHQLPIQEDILSNPNNLLGIEYCKAILTQNSSLVPFTVKRIGDSYHEATASEGSYCSATALRALLSDMASNIFESANSLDCSSVITTFPTKAPATQSSKLIPQVPSEVLPVYLEAIRNLSLMTAEDFSELLSYRLLYETADTLSTYADWNPELANRILTKLTCVSGFEQAAALLKSKQLTLTRANRMLLHVLLHITTEQLQTAREQGSCFYARLLGLREFSSKALRHLSDHCTVPVINKLAPAEKELRGIASELLQQDIRAAKLYDMVQQRKRMPASVNEYTRGIIRI